MFIPPREFERLTEEALASLPPQFAELIQNVVVVVEVVVVVVAVDCVAGTTGVNGACAKLAVAARANPVVQSADLICVLFISNTFLLVIFVTDGLVSLAKPRFQAGVAQLGAYPKTSKIVAKHLERASVPE